MCKNNSIKIIEQHIAHSFKSLLLVVFLTLFSAQQLIAQQPVVATDTTSIQIGEALKVYYAVEVSNTDLVVFPEAKNMGLLEVIASYKIDTLKHNNTYRLKKEYHLTQFDSGHYTIPQQKIIINGKPFVTDSLQIEVRDVAVDTTKQKLYNIKPIVLVEKPKTTPFKYIVLGVLLFLAILAYLFFYKKRQVKKEVAKKIAPFEAALLQLEKLDNEQLLEHKAFKKYYSELTDVLKHYLDEKVYSNALEHTSDELIAKLELLKDSGRLPIKKESIVALKKVLQTADLVKFAKSQPDQGTAKVDRGTIEKMLHETKAAIPAPTEEELLRDEQYRIAQEKKQRRKKRIRIAIISGVLIVIIGVGLGFKYGFSTLKDELIGHPTKELLEGKWVRSTYGNPPITISTPAVLKRTSQTSQGAESFSYGSITSNLAIMLTTVQLPPTAQAGMAQLSGQSEDENEAPEIDLEQVNEATIHKISSENATDIVIKHDEYTQDGITGAKAYGSASVTNPVTNTTKIMQYILVSFQQENAIQQVFIMYEDTDVYAKKISPKVLNSITLKTSEN